MSAVQSTFKITFYLDKSDPRASCVDIDWDIFSDILSNPEQVEVSPCTIADGPNKCKGGGCPHKSHSIIPGNPMAWAPTEIEGNRLDKNVRFITLLALDFDHLTTSEAVTVIETLTPYTHVRHTTHNHRSGDICFRAVLALSRPVHANHWHHFRKAAVAFLNVPADPSCKDRSRQYFRPSRPSDATGHDAQSVRGRVLDVDAVLAWSNANAPQAAPIASERAAMPEAAEWDLNGDAVIGAIDCGARFFPDRQRHELCMAFAGMLRRAGASQEVAKYIVEEIAREGNSTDPEMRARTVDHTYALDDTDAAMTGFTRVSEIIGEDEAKEFGDFLTTAANDAFLRGLTPLTPSQPNGATVTPIRSVPTPIDLADLKKRISALAAKKNRSFERDDKIDAVILRRVLRGTPITTDNDVETRRDGAEKGVTLDDAVRMIANAFAYKLPTHTPWEAVAELLRPSLLGTNSIEAAERIFKSAQTSRLRKAAELAASVEAKIHAPITNGAAPPDGPRWEDLLSRAGDGTLESVPHNVRIILRNHADFCGWLRWNEITKAVEITGGPMKRYEKAGLEAVMTGIQDHLSLNHGIKTDFQSLVRRVVSVVREVGSYDPLKEYLLGLDWDGTERLDNWLTNYCGAVAEDEAEGAYIKTIGKRWMIGAVARALEPGCKCDTMLIMESEEQGEGKSTLFKVLGGKFFSDTPIDISNKDSRLMVAVSWIVEMAELQGFKVTDDDKRKGFLSQCSDRFRPPYGAVMEDFPRRGIFAATTNKRVYLTDDTGNRRYWSVLVKLINLGAIRRDRDQLFAEAVHLFLGAEECDACAELRQDDIAQRCTHHRWWLSKDEDKIAQQQAEKREEEVAWVLQIHEWWIGLTPALRPKQFSTDEIATKVLNIDSERITDGLRKKIGTAMRKLKFPKERIRIAGVRHWLYVPNDDLLNLPYVVKAERVRTAVPTGMHAMPGMQQKPN